VWCWVLSVLVFLAFSSVPSRNCRQYIMPCYDHSLYHFFQWIIYYYSILHRRIFWLSDGVVITA